MVCTSAAAVIISFGLQVMAMVDESARMMEAANPGLQSAVGDGEKCDTCKLIVVQVATMLRDPVSTHHFGRLPCCMHTLICAQSVSCGLLTLSVLLHLTVLVVDVLLVMSGHARRHMAVR